MPKRLKSFSLPRIGFPASDFQSENNSLYSDSVNTGIRNSGLTGVKQNRMRQNSGSAFTPGSLFGGERGNSSVATVLIYHNIGCFNNLSSCACCNCVLVCIFRGSSTFPYKYLSTWIVTFTCLAIASSVACICHALIFISDLASSFVLPENFVRIFEPVDIVDIARFVCTCFPHYRCYLLYCHSLYYAEEVSNSEFTRGGG